MRLAILADVHSNLPALQAVLDDLESVEVDEVIVAGDVINAGPFPCEVLDIVHDQGFVLLRGNHEQYVLDYRNPRTSSKFAASRWANVRWTSEQLDADDVAFVCSWPLELERNGILIVHGAPDDLSGGITINTPDEEISRRFGKVAQRWVVTAHTHNPFVRQWEHLTLINPGAVGMPLDGNPAASYAILDVRDDTILIEHRRVDYDTNPLEKAAHQRGFLEVGGGLAHLFLQEMLTGRPHVVPYLHRVYAFIDQHDVSEEVAFAQVPLF